MREDINNIKNEIVTMATSKSNINDIWLVFKTSLEKSVNLNIPHKQARTKDSPPWISRDLKRLIRKRDRLYKKKKKSHDKKDSEKYKTIKRQVQQGLRRSYWKYVESIVTPPEDNIIENRGFNIDATSRLIPTSRASRTTRTGCFQVPLFRTDIRKMSFYPKSIREWNALPLSTTTAPSLECFKARLTK
ncbi:unnamed protein product [Mytilus edulis]|uniref:Uncharacterized protein n=1 Tax=Mytilus edulis TaxID=6550 RepID=A0A8S3UIS9_MYTED|nr:unnamed protein product [Mytilus edulis]